MTLTTNQPGRPGIATILIAVLVLGTGREAIAAADQGAPDPKRYDVSGAGVPDAGMVARVATTLGVGKTVDVKTTGGKKLRARLASVDESSLTVAHGRFSTPVVIAYDEVTQLKPAGLHWAAKTAIGVGVFYGVSGLALLLCYSSGNCAS